MIYRLYANNSEKLLHKPETGMGYQIIEASTYFSNSLRKYVVYNSEVALDLDSSFLNIKAKLFSNRVVNYSINGENKFQVINSLPEIILKSESINVLSRNQAPIYKAFSAIEKAKNKRHSGTTGAKDNRIESANGEEIFVRLSAFQDDKRIDFEERKLKNGSYTTTEQDYKDCVSEKDDPVDRYALPNQEEIKWSFYIQPKKTVDTLQRGIVQPAFEHAGGGIECYFGNGTSRGTYLKTCEYGK